MSLAGTSKFDRSPFLLDPEITFLNHGSFGSCPAPVLAAQSRLRERLEAQPVRFMVRELEGLLDEARAEIGRFLGCSPDDFCFLPNATAGVNTVLRSLTFSQGDELLTTNHAYNACKNALDYVGRESGAAVVVVDVPFPVESADDIAAAILRRVTPRTRLALLDHVTSPTGIIFPIPQLVAELDRRGVDTLVDGAHAPGMIPVHIDAWGAAYYTGNFHKWVCAPKGAAFLHVRRDRQARIRPLSISHGANSPRRDRAAFRLESDWTGTDDPTPHLCVPEALRFMQSQLPGGWPEVMRANHDKVVAARALLCRALDVPPPCPNALLGSLAAIPLPDGADDPTMTHFAPDALQDRLYSEYQIEVPIIPFPRTPKRLIRVSAQLYNTDADYARLAAALSDLLPRSHHS